MHKRAEYLEVQSRGLRVQAPHFILLVLPTGREAFGITVTRKIAGAVGRNRVKRVCREVYRLNRQLFPADCAVVAVARSGAHQLGYAAVQAEFAGASLGLQRAASRAAKPR
jgi:ribonuclease P protein component